MKIAALILSLGAVVTLSACEAEQTEKDLLAEAQFCLDDARDDASAKVCTSKISGLTGPRASALQCAAGFIGAQVTRPENLAKALDSVKESSNGTVALFSSISFPDVGEVNRTFIHCQASGQKGMMLMGALAKSATLISSAALDFSSCTDITSCDTTAISDTLEGLLQNLNSSTPDPEAQATVLRLTETIRDVYGATCSDGNNVNGDICREITNAVGHYDIKNADSTDLLEIGKQLLQNWKGH